MLSIFLFSFFPFFSSFFMKIIITIEMKFITPYIKEMGNLETIYENKRKSLRIYLRNNVSARLPANIKFGTMKIHVKQKIIGRDFSKISLI